MEGSLVVDGADWTFQWRSGLAGVSFALLQLLIVQIVFHKPRKCTCTTIIQISITNLATLTKENSTSAENRKQKTMAGAPDYMFVSVQPRPHEDK